MKEALRKQITVGKNGSLEIPPLDLPEGTMAEIVVIVHTEDEPVKRPSLMDLFGAGKGIYGTREEIDAYIEAERDSWH